MTDSEKQDWQKYIDNTISHAIGAVEYGNYFYDEVKGIADEAKDDCQAILEDYNRCGTKSRCNELKKEIDKRLLEMEDDIAAFIAFELPKIIEDEDEWLDENIKPLFNIKLGENTKLIKQLSIIPIATAGAAISFGTLISNRLKAIYNSEITQSYITGISLKELKTDYESRFSSFDRGLEADAETLGSSLGNQYERIIFTKNNSIIKRYMWSSMLDTSTCIVCGMLDGQIYDDITNVQIYPAHDRCRCRIIPLPDFVSDDEAKTTYLEWFERQPVKEKRAILGKTRFQLYEQGMKIKQFVNNGKITPLKDIKK